MTPEKIAELRALAEGATVGPWACTASGFVTTKEAADGSSELVIVDGDQCIPQGWCDSNFIAAANPQAVLSLLDEIESERRVAKGWHDKAAEERTRGDLWMADAKGAIADKGLAIARAEAAEAREAVKDAALGPFVAEAEIQLPHLESADDDGLIWADSALTVGAFRRARESLVSRASQPTVWRHLPLPPSNGEDRT